MTTALDRPAKLAAPTRMASASPDSPERPRRFGRAVWNRFSLTQLIVLGLGTVAPLVIGATLSARLLGLISTETMIDVALAAGEEPGMFTFAAMFLASPVQWLTGHTQVRVRKYLGIVFFLLGLSNGAMFAIEEGIGGALSEPFLIAGTGALTLSAPLFLTSSRWSQRVMGMRAWRLLHKATYGVAVALVAHVLLIPEFGVAETLIALGLIFRIPAIRRRIIRLKPTAA